MTTSGQNQTLLTKSYLKHPYIRIFFLFLLVECFLLTWAWGVRRLVPDYYPEGALELYQGVAIQTNPWLEPWQRWDTPLYQAIAERGYSAFELSHAYLPLYPGLMKFVAPIFCGNTLVSGLFISGLAFLGILLVSYKISLKDSSEESKAIRTVVYLAFFPAAFFLVAAYNESLFLLFIMLCLYNVRMDRWLSAGVFAGLASLTRIPGILLLIPLSYAVWKSWKNGNRSSWIAIGIMGLTVTGYYFSQWIIYGISPTATISSQYKWGAYLTIPGLNIIEVVKRIWNGQYVIQNSFELFFTLLFILFTIQVWKKLPRLYGIYSASLMIFFLARFGFPQPLMSMVRYTYEIFPVFFVLAQWGTKPAWNRVILYLSWLGLLFFSAQFATWGWVG